MNNCVFSTLLILDYNWKLRVGRYLGLWVVMGDFPTPKIFNAFIVECANLLELL